MSKGQSERSPEERRACKMDGDGVKIIRENISIRPRHKFPTLVLRLDDKREVLNRLRMMRQKVKVWKKERGRSRRCANAFCEFGRGSLVESLDLLTAFVHAHDAHADTCVHACIFVAVSSEPSVSGNRRKRTFHDVPIHSKGPHSRPPDIDNAFRTFRSLWIVTADCWLGASRRARERERMRAWKGKKGGEGGRDGEEDAGEREKKEKRQKRKRTLICFSVLRRTNAYHSCKLTICEIKAANCLC